MKKTLSTKIAVLPAKITTSDLEQAGIHTSLNQGDVVEILATEAFNQIMEQVKVLREKGELLSGKFKNILVGKEVENFIKELAKLGITVEESSIQRTWLKPNNCSCHYYHVLASQENNKEDSYNIFTQNICSYVPISKTGLKMILRFTEIVNVESVKGGVEILTSTTNTYEKEVVIKYSEISAILKEAKDYEKEIVIFLEAIPKNQSGTRTISLSKIMKDVRVKVNKNIIKSQAPNIQAQLEQLFNIQL